jgi:hypothetical protein
VDLAAAGWRKSSHSGNNGGDCVEVAGNLRDAVAVRDSKDPWVLCWFSVPGSGGRSLRG